MVSGKSKPRSPDAGNSGSFSPNSQIGGNALADDEMTIDSIFSMRQKKPSTSRKVSTRPQTPNKKSSNKKSPKSSSKSKVSASPKTKSKKISKPQDVPPLPTAIVTPSKSSTIKTSPKSSSSKTSKSSKSKPKIPKEIPVSGSPASSSGKKSKAKKSSPSSSKAKVSSTEFAQVPSNIDMPPKIPHRELSANPKKNDNNSPASTADLTLDPIIGDDMDDERPLSEKFSEKRLSMSKKIICISILILLVVIGILLGIFLSPNNGVRGEQSSSVVGVNDNDENPDENNIFLDQQPSEAPTNTVSPTNTFSPTATYAPTNTFQPTRTFEPTYSPTNEEEEDLLPIIPSDPSPVEFEEEEETSMPTEYPTQIGGELICRDRNVNNINDVEGRDCVWASKNADSRCRRRWQSKSIATYWCRRTCKSLTTLNIDCELE